MAQIPSADLPVVSPQTGRINLEWYAALQRLVSEIAALGGGGVTSFEGRTGVVVSAAGDYTAAEVTNAPAGGIAAVTVQAAIDELDAEKQPLDADLTALAALAATGLVARTGAATYAERTLTAPAAGITVSNGGGVAGNPTLALANDLAALEAMAGTGIVARTAAETYAQRTITGGTAITVTNGDGIAGNPTVAITAGGVGTTQLADNGVTAAKIEDAEAYTLLLRNAGTTGDPDFVKISALTNAGAFGSGDKLMIEESSGELRKIDYDDLPGSGATSDFVLLDSGTVSAAAQLDVVLTAHTAYRALLFKLHDFLPVTDNVIFQALLSTDGGSSFIASGYQYASLEAQSDAAAIDHGQSASATQINICEEVANNANYGVSIDFQIARQAGTTRPRVWWDGAMWDIDDDIRRLIGAGGNTTAQDTNAVRFKFSSGNIASATWALYGFA
jgi:hypothetical protein